MSLYTQAMGEIEFSDIEGFVKQDEAESIILEYKRDWTHSLPKEIAGLANTSGGLIMIGVSEKAGTGKPEKIIGVENAQGEDALRRRVTEAAYDAIYPPILPEVQVCSLRDDPTRAVLIVRVAQSNHTPHAIDSRRKVYVRVDSLNKPHERLASLQELQWLWDRRRKTEEARDLLVEAAEERAKWARAEGTADVSHSASTDHWPILRIWIGPHFYSGRQAFLLSEVREIVLSLSRKRITSDFGTSFPTRAYETRSVGGGYCIFVSQTVQSRPASPAEYAEAEYIELGETGLVFSELRQVIQDERAGWPQLSIGSVLGHIDGFLKFAASVYEQADLWGLLSIRAVLHHIQGTELDIPGHGRFLSSRDMHVKHRAGNQTISLIDEVFGKNDLESSRSRIVKQAAKSMLWAFGHDWKEEDDFDAIYLALSP